VTTAALSEPVIATMELDQDLITEATFRPDASKGLTAYELWQVHKERLNLRKQYLDHWNATANSTGTGSLHPIAVTALSSPTSLKQVALWMQLSLPPHLTPRRHME
jgi:hypothetical protein